MAIGIFIEVLNRNIEMAKLLSMKRNNVGNRCIIRTYTVHSSLRNSFSNYFHSYVYGNKISSKMLPNCIRIIEMCMRIGNHNSTWTSTFASEDINPPFYDFH